MNDYVKFRRKQKAKKQYIPVQKPHYERNSETGDVERVWYCGERKYRICPKLVLDTMPFVQWLALGYKIYDYKKLSVHKLNNYWLDYRLHMVTCGLLYEPAHKFGLWG